MTQIETYKKKKVIKILRKNICDNTFSLKIKTKPQQTTTTSKSQFGHKGTRWMVTSHSHFSGSVNPSPFIRFKRFDFLVDLFFFMKLTPNSVTNSIINKPINFNYYMKRIKKDIRTTSNFIVV